MPGSLSVAGAVLAEGSRLNRSTSDSAAVVWLDLHDPFSPTGAVPGYRRGQTGSQRLRRCLARCDTEVTAESADRNMRGVAASESRLVAALASR